MVTPAPPRLRWIGYGVAGFVIVLGLAFAAGYVSDYLSADHVDPLQRAVELVRGCVIGALLAWIGLLTLVRTVRLDRADLTRHEDDAEDAAVARCARHVSATVCGLCAAAGAAEIAVVIVWAAGDHHAGDGRGWFDHLGTVFMAGVAAGVLLGLYRANVDTGIRQTSLHRYRTTRRRRGCTETRTAGCQTREPGPGKADNGPDVGRQVAEGEAALAAR